MGEPDDTREEQNAENPGAEDGATPETPSETGGSDGDAAKTPPGAEVEEPEVLDGADGVEPEVIQAEEVEVIEPASVGPGPTEADALREKLDGVHARLRTVSKAYTDLQAEMAAFRNRMEAQGKVKVERQAFDAVKALLDPVQNLKRSIASPGEDVEALVGGLKLVEKQFMDALRKLGLEEVPGEGATFDPKFHEALAVMPVEEPEKDGKVLMVHQGGYSVNGKVLQAAQVVIGKHEATAAEA